MSDSALRKLERAAASGDEVAAELRLARARAGLAPHGGELPANGSVIVVGEMTLEMVSVPDTPLCRGFRISRYPVTWEDWQASPLRRPWCPSCMSQNPAAGMTFDEAGEFCRWSGTELPTEREWMAACGFSSRDDLVRGAEPEPAMRAYPWGAEHPHAGLVWADLPAGVLGTAPVRVDGLPARPRGASPYGLQDAIGNVACWVRSGGVVGPSWRSNSLSCEYASPHQAPLGGKQDDVGFRVVVRAVE